jgi:hypothetical protein
VAGVVSDPVLVPDLLAEIQSGGGQSLSAAGRMFPGHRGGKSVDPSTVFRWVTKGLRTPAGRVVKLDAVRVGGRWLTSNPAIARFVVALTDDATPASNSPIPPTRTPNARHRAARKANSILESMGS